MTTSSAHPLHAPDDCLAHSIPFVTEALQVSTRTVQRRIKAGELRGVP